MAILLLSVLGCTSPFEGTWLFMVDNNTKVTGDCADEDDTTTYTGTSNSWVDIFQTGSGEFVVLISEPLVGTAAGGELEASWEDSYESEDYTDSEVVTFNGALAGATMSGSVTDASITSSGGDMYTCAYKYDFTAERTTSSPSAYPED